MHRLLGAAILQMYKLLNEEAMRMGTQTADFGKHVV